MDVRQAISMLYHADEAECVNQLLQQWPLTPSQQDIVQQRAQEWISAIRKSITHSTQLSAFLAEYQLSTHEGMAVMALAEALLRIPDNENVDKLIEEELAEANWEIHLAHSPSKWVNAATWGLLLAGKILEENTAQNWTHVWHQLVKRVGKPVIRQSVKAALNLMGSQFVFAQTIDDAREQAQPTTEVEASLHLYSFDMLGESALTEEDAQRYFQNYLRAIKTIGKNYSSFSLKNASISIKLSALHPRFEYSKQKRLRRELFPRLLQLAHAAKSVNVGLTIDAEEAVRLDITLDALEFLAREPTLTRWYGLGIAIQAYQKRAVAVINWVIQLARETERCLSVRLVKGAYWDAEIKGAQTQGVSDYPVFTRKEATDMSYLVCASKMLAAPDAIYAQFATHNAYTIAAIAEMADKNAVFEWQRLHGMGEALYEAVLKKTGRPCRVYAPVGRHEVLLPYLARRLLENGANNAFVRQLADPNISLNALTADPYNILSALETKRNDKIPLPQNVYAAWIAAKGYDISDRLWGEKWLPQLVKPNMPRTPFSTTKHIQQVITEAEQAWPAWDAKPVHERAQCILRAADLLEAEMLPLMNGLIFEGKKTIVNAQAEVREAIDYCRYYAYSALEVLKDPHPLPSITGEQNIFSYQARGVLVCISPWNFPLAIFLGQIIASLVMGNAVIAKPAEQTPQIAIRAIECLYKAGIPETILALVFGDGAVGQQLVSDPRIAGVIFTGSLDTARKINITLANRKTAPIVPFIAETGGVNAMVVDSTALLEQAAKDILSSAFDSAGQRCSALRLLLVQEEIADALIAFIAGAMAQLDVGDPSALSTDIPPIIDKEALSHLQKHQQWLHKKAKLIYQVNMDEGLKHLDTFFAPCAYELQDIADLNAEVFGPILHVLRYKTPMLQTVLDQLEDKGFGLTFAIQSRLPKSADNIADKMRVGNIYINRNMIGATVGSQPFGGQRLSGTGPKAGGAQYLLRLVTEKVVSINTAAAGGNARLMTL